jgi:hypothetical protein
MTQAISFVFRLIIILIRVSELLVKVIIVEDMVYFDRNWLVYKMHYMFEQLSDCLLVIVSRCSCCHFKIYFT